MRRKTGRFKRRLLELFTLGARVFTEIRMANDFCLASNSTHAITGEKIGLFTRLSLPMSGVHRCSKQGGNTPVAILPSSNRRPFFHGARAHSIQSRRPITRFFPRCAHCFPCRSPLDWSSRFLRASPADRRLCTLVAAACQFNAITSAPGHCPSGNRFRLCPKSAALAVNRFVGRV